MMFFRQTTLLSAAAAGLLLSPALAYSTLDESNNNNKRSNSIRRVQIDVDAQPAIGWVFAPEAKMTCDAACAAVGGTCNLEAQNAVDSAEKLQYVVELLELPQGSAEGLILPASATTTIQGGSAVENPSYSNFQNMNAYYFNDLANNAAVDAGTCDGDDADSIRICCCGATADCPVA
jgi:hypothetical protein